MNDSVVCEDAYLLEVLEESLIVLKNSKDVMLIVINKLVEDLNLNNSTIIDLLKEEVNVIQGEIDKLSVTLSKHHAPN